MIKTRSEQLSPATEEYNAICSARRGLPALAIGAGLSDGLGFGANARIALINRGLRELTR